MDYTECERLKKEIIPYLQEHLKESRYVHTMNVTNLAKEMAVRYGADVHKAEIAALQRTINSICRRLLGGRSADEYAASINAA